jgi:hypothetical protein
MELCDKVWVYVVLWHPLVVFIPVTFPFDEIFELTTEPLAV